MASTAIKAITRGKPTALAFELKINMFTERQRSGRTRTGLIS